MRVLVIAPYTINSPHYETELEIIQNHLDGGDQIAIATCSAVLATCDVNPHHDVSVCVSCMGRRDAGLRLLSQKIEQTPLINLSDTEQEELAGTRREFSSLDDLRAYTIDNFDIGYGALSSIISILREPEPDPADSRVQLLIARNIVSSLAVYRSVRRCLREGGYDRVYVYNGRYAPLRAVLRACQAEGVECLTHETGCDLQHYTLLVNTTIHDIDYAVAEIRSLWEQADPVERQRIGEEFYQQSARGVSTNWFSYIDDQKPDELPANWRSDRLNVAIYVSSDDEFAAMGDMWRNPIYDDQIDGIERIVASLRQRPDVHLYVRVHPNLKGIDNAQTRRLAALAAPNLTLIPAESSISSYALMRGASTVVTFGSTVGIEAVYWGKPSILAGQSFYRQLGATYNPASHEDLVAMIRNDLAPKEPIGALMYGYYMKTFGILFRLVERQSIYQATFRSRRIAAAGAYRSALQLLRYRRSRRLARAVLSRQLQRALGVEV